MKKFGILTIVVAGLAVLAMAVLGGPAPTATAQTPQGPAQSDHALLGPLDDAVYAGVALVGNQAEPYTLYVAATGGPCPAKLTITFRDKDAITFPISLGTSFSTAQALGGVPGVDDVVKITVRRGGGLMVGSDGKVIGTCTPGEGGSAMVSVEARAGAKDPFANDGELDNFTLTKSGDPELGDPGDLPSPF